MKAKKFVIGLVILVVLQAFLVTPFLHKGLYMSHDNVQVTRVFEMSQALKYGGFPAYWNSGLLFDFGYPLFTFYPPLVYLIGSAFVSLGFNFIWATKMVFLLGFIVGGTGMYILSRKIFESEMVGVVSGAAYSLAPYRAVDVYVRGALAEFFAYSLMPWVVWLNVCFWKEKNDGRKRKIVVFFSILTALLILTHNLSALMLLFLLVPLNLYYWLSEKTKSIPHLLMMISGGFLTLVLTCFYWWPVLVESPLVRLSAFENYRYDQHFQTLQQLWSSSWGFLGSNQIGGMSLMLGKTMITVSLIVIVLNNIRRTKYRGLINILAGCAAVFIFLETKWSWPIWQKVNLLHYLQFPWRMHTIITLLLSLLTGAAFVYVGKQKQVVLGVLFGLVIGCLLIENLGYFRQARFSDEVFFSETTTWDDEYLPVWVKKKPVNCAIDKVWIATGSGTIKNIEWGYWEKKFTVEAEKNVTVTVSQVYYPGWRAYINGAETVINYQNEQGAMSIVLPPGKNEAVFRFQETPYRKTAVYISLAGLILALGVLIKKNDRK